MTGVVKRTYPEKGYCFLRPSGAPQPDIFAHVRGFRDQEAFTTLVGGEQVEFRVQQDPLHVARVCATDVVVLG